MLYLSIAYDKNSVARVYRQLSLFAYFMHLSDPLRLGPDPASARQELSQRSGGKWSGIF